MGSRTLAKLNVSPETLRAMSHMAYRVMGWFINLEGVQQSLLNSRLIEYPFVAQKLDRLPRGKVLDLGCADAGNSLAPTLAALGWQVYGLDIREFRLVYPNFSFFREDVRKTSFPDSFFDAAYAVSTVEHIGLAGRYSVREDDPEGDLKAVQEVRRVVRPGGTFVVTIPYGEAAIARPLHRVYDKARLGRLIESWEVRDEVYWLLDSEGCWRGVPEQVAAKTKPHSVAIAMLELVRP